MDKVLIITGGSKGIGAGIISAYLANNYSVISIARTQNTEQAFKAVHQIEFDLNQIDKIKNLLTETFKLIDVAKLKAITLINNAGKLGEITTIEHRSVKDIDETIRLNTTVPLILISCFLALTKKLTCRKKIINISSGAAKNPYFGWVSYCASKAAIDMMTRSVAVEQETIEYGAEIISIYPGVVDTDMQKQIRKSDKTDFIDLDKFIDYKNSGLLSSIDYVGREVYEIDHDEQVENGALIRVGE